jgi:hypothetical protein
VLAQRRLEPTFVVVVGGGEGTPRRVWVLRRDRLERLRHPQFAVWECPPNRSTADDRRAFCWRLLYHERVRTGSSVLAEGPRRINTHDARTAPGVCVRRSNTQDRARTASQEGTPPTQQGSLHADPLARRGSEVGFRRHRKRLSRSTCDATGGGSRNSPHPTRRRSPTVATVPAPPRVEPRS